MKKIILLLVFLGIVACSPQEQKEIKYEPYKSELPKEKLRYKNSQDILNQLEKISSEKKFDDIVVKLKIDDYDVELILFEDNLGVSSLSLSFDSNKANSVVETLNKIQKILNLNEINKQDFIKEVASIPENEQISFKTASINLQKVEDRIVVTYNTF